MSETPSSANYDVVIVGGGMIGTSLALALQPLSLRVAVVEAVARASAAQPSFDDRSTALSRSTQRMFEAMGLWDEIRAASTPIKRIHVSDKGRFGFSHIDAEEQGVEALGYVVINRVLGEVLNSALAGANIDFLCPARISDVQLGPDVASAVALQPDGRETPLRSSLLVAADGANSLVREKMGISARQTPYAQRAIIGNVLSERAHDNVAYERFTEQGPLAMLPISEERAAFVWIVQEAAAEATLALDDAAFTAKLQEVFGNRLGEFSKIGKRASYPLALSEAARLTATRSVVVGNAAHGLHPVAAQGFNLGMRDVAALCDCIADEVQSAVPDLGNTELLQRFAEWRRPDQKKLVRFTDGLIKLFASKSRSLRALRNAGMLGFDFVPGVRGEFARQTMGLAGRLPRLSRGVPLK
jgi:2-octaprenyl-6-methoxyphenol hydroxylase